jgi:hypothetical protein
MRFTPLALVSFIIVDMVLYDLFLSFVCVDYDVIASILTFLCFRMFVVFCARLSMPLKSVKQVLATIQSICNLIKTASSHHLDYLSLCLCQEWDMQSHPLHTVLVLRCTGSKFY